MRNRQGRNVLREDSREDGLRCQRSRACYLIGVSLGLTAIKDRRIESICNILEHLWPGAYGWKISLERLRKVAVVLYKRGSKEEALQDCQMAMHFQDSEFTDLIRIMTEHKLQIFVILSVKEKLPR